VESQPFLQKDWMPVYLRQKKAFLASQLVEESAMEVYRQVDPENRKAQQYWKEVIGESVGADAKTKIDLYGRGKQEEDEEDDPLEEGRSEAWISARGRGRGWREGKRWLRQRVDKRS
jgi:hypothetical protein